MSISKICIEKSMMDDSRCITCKNCQKNYRIEKEYELRKFENNPFFCNPMCKKTFEANQRWISNEYDPTPKSLTGKSSERIDRAFFKKNMA